MPHRGFYTQGISVLLDKETTLDSMADCLREYQVVSKREETQDWSFGGPTLVLAYRPEVNGYVSADVVNRRWPDYMGDPNLHAPRNARKERRP